MMDDEKWEAVNRAMCVLREEVKCVLAHWNDVAQVNEDEVQWHVYMVMKHFEQVTKGVFVIGDEVLKSFADNQTQAQLVKEKLELELGRALTMSVSRDGTAVFNVEEVPDDIRELE